MDLKIDLSTTGIAEDEISAMRDAALSAYETLRTGSMEFSGWVRLPERCDSEELKDILSAADEIKQKCDLLIVIGIGGSYLGARAVTEALAHTATGGVEVRFAGNNMSAAYHSEILADAEKREVCLCVISKSGTTTEPSMAFALLKDMLVRKYGKAEAHSRIYAVTDAKRGIMREEADREGYRTFVIPDDIGGRYSVLTAVGLLPIAAAGIDVRALLDGARAACAQDVWRAQLTDYAICRYLLAQAGKAIEIFEYYEPQLQYFAEWLKQLFGESEGKEGKGIFPASLSFSADLHSMGQFLQEGRQMFFETVLDVCRPHTDLLLPDSAGELLAGRSMNAVNRAALNGVIAAHRNIGIPIVKIDIPALTPTYMGQMIYFFEMTCAVAGLLMGVNPFDQPGVESYKNEMKKELMK